MNKREFVIEIEEIFVRGAVSNQSRHVRILVPLPTNITIAGCEIFILNRPNRLNGEEMVKLITETLENIALLRRDKIARAGQNAFAIECGLKPFDREALLLIDIDKLDA